MSSKQNLREWGQKWKDHYCRMASRLDELDAENKRLRRERDALLILLAERRVEP